MERIPAPAPYARIDAAENPFPSLPTTKLEFEIIGAAKSIAKTFEVFMFRKERPTAFVEEPSNTKAPYDFVLS